MSKFQIVLLSVFGFFILVAVAVFALYRGGSSANQATIVFWGDIPTESMSQLLNSTIFSGDRAISIRYVEKSPQKLESEWTEALAAGSGPDLIILSQDQYWKNRSKLTPIPYQSVSEKGFKEAFIEAGEIYLAPEGVYGLPLVLDPMVLYYNRDLLSSAGLAKPIAFWDEIYKESTDLTKRDGAGNLTQSTIALGGTSNIPHYKDILALLMIQAGNPITSLSGTDLRSLLSSNFNMTLVPAETALDFYTQFANPTKAFYSWNRNLSSAQTHFASADSAYYLGFGSELRALRNKNPTLNFSVAPVPQSRVSGKTVTVGKLYSVSVSRGSRDLTASLTAALKLVSAESAGTLSSILYLPPARRDLLSQKPTDSVLPVFYNSALQSRSWVDPDTSGTEKIFSDMIESVTSGRARTSEAVSKASRELEALIGR